MGSIPPAASIEHDQREIVEVRTQANTRGYHDFSDASCGPPSPSDLHQLRKAIEGFIRNGLGSVLLHGGNALGGPNDYNTVTLVPPLQTAAYVDFLMLLVVPAVTNRGAVTLNMNGIGVKPVLRNDGAQLQSGDWIIGKPHLIAYYGSNFWMVGLCNSQVPIVKTGVMDVWVRMDGNDATGDGSANDAAHAYKTIAGAWQGVAGRYSASPLFAINIRLGQVGTYDGAILGPFGGTVLVTGDTANIGSYRIKSNVDLYGLHPSPATMIGLGFLGINFGVVQGMTLQLDQASPDLCYPLMVNNSSIVTDFVNWDATVSSPGAYVYQAGIYGLQDSTTCVFEGNGHTLHSLWFHLGGAQTHGALNKTAVPQAIFRNTTCSNSCFYLREASVCGWNDVVPSQSGIHGPQYNVTTNSILYGHGHTIPGDAAGVTSLNGIFIP